MFISENIIMQSIMCNMRFFNRISFYLIIYHAFIKNTFFHVSIDFDT